MNTRNRDLVTCVVLLALTALLALATVTLPASSLRMWLVVIVLTTAPGWALVAFRSPARTSLAWTMAVSGSLACSMLTSLALLLTHWWHPMAGFVALLSVTAVLLGWHVVRLGVIHR